MTTADVPYHSTNSVTTLAARVEAKTWCIGRRRELAYFRSTEGKMHDHVLQEPAPRTYVCVSQTLIWAGGCLHVMLEDILHYSGIKNSGNSKTIFQRCSHHLASEQKLSLLNMRIATAIEGA